MIVLGQTLLQSFGRNNVQITGEINSFTTHSCSLSLFLFRTHFITLDIFSRLLLCVSVFALQYFVWFFFIKSFLVYFIALLYFCILYLTTIQCVRLKWTLRVCFYLECVCVRRALGWCTLGGRTKTWKRSTAISTCSNVKQHLNLGFVTLHYTIRFLLLSSYHIPSPRKILAFFSLLSSLLILIQREPRWQLIFRSLFSLPTFLSLCLSSAHW